MQLAVDSEGCRLVRALRWPLPPRGPLARRSGPFPALEKYKNGHAQGPGLSTARNPSHLPRSAPGQIRCPLHGSNAMGSSRREQLERDRAELRASPRLQRHGFITTLAPQRRRTRSNRSPRLQRHGFITTGRCRLRRRLWVACAAMLAAEGDQHGIRSKPPASGCWPCVPFGTCQVGSVPVHLAPAGARAIWTSGSCHLRYGRGWFQRRLAAALTAVMPTCVGLSPATSARLLVQEELS